MKHNIRLIDFFNKQEKIIIITSFTFFSLLGAYISFTNYTSGLFFLIFSFIPVLGIFIYKSKKLLIEVIRITENNGVSRLNYEYWNIKDVRKLDRKFFWRKNNKLIVIGHERKTGFSYINPFIKPLPIVTTGHIKRSSIQDSTDELMIPDKTSLKEAVILGGTFLLCGGLAILNYAMFNNMLEKL